MGADNYRKVDSPPKKQKLVDLMKRVTEYDNSNAAVWEIYGLLLGIDVKEETETDIEQAVKGVDCYVKAFRCLQQSLNFPKDFEELQKSAELLETVQPKLDDLDFISTHDSIQTGLTALKATCQAQLDKLEASETNKLYQLCLKIAQGN